MNFITMKNKNLLKHMWRLTQSHTRKNWLIAAFVAATATGCTSQQVPTVYDQILQNIVAQETEGIDVKSVDANTEKYLKLLNADGAFTDIDYSSHAQTDWKPANHVSRLKDMVVSYVSPESHYYEDEQLYEKIVKMFSYWYDANPTSTNWWFHEIGWAQRMGLSLSLMRAGNQQVPDSLEHKILERMKTVSKGPDQPGSQGTGANKMDIALQWIYRTCLQEDKANLDFAIQQFFYPIKFNSEQGIQRDYSYLQHGQQLYTGGYGGAVLDAFLKVAFYIEHTPYVDEEKNKLMSEFVRYGNLPFIRGKYMLFNPQGRGVARINNSNRSGWAKGLGRLMKLNKEHTDVYEASIARLKGTKPASFSLSPWHQHFWRADYTVHQRPEYTMDVRTASTRTVRCENGNGENLLGYFITEGGTGIVRRGDEYNNIFPSWDWSHIPGTTTPSLKEIPLPEQWGDYGQSTFTGGVSDGVYGVTTYQMKDEHFDIHSSAKKSWFFFDKEVVCMGSDIRSSNSHPMHTTVNLCLRNVEVSVATSGKDNLRSEDGTDNLRSENGTDNLKSEIIPEEQVKQFNNLVCVSHDSISYYFPEGGNLYVSNMTQVGSWNDLCAHQPDTPVAQPVFKLWFDHRARPTQGSYIYYVLPNTGSPTEAINTMDELTTSNNRDIQAVYNHNLNTLGVVFHQKGTLKIAGMEVTSSTPCAAMFTHIDTDTIKAYISDPSYQLKETSLTLKGPGMSSEKTLNCQFKTDVHEAGSTHVYEIVKKD